MLSGFLVILVLLQWHLNIWCCVALVFAVCLFMRYIPSVEVFVMSEWDLNVLELSVVFRK